MKRKVSLVALLNHILFRNDKIWHLIFVMRYHYVQIVDDFRQLHGGYKRKKQNEINVKVHAQIIPKA